jgi:hypothetical protein
LQKYAFAVAAVVLGSALCGGAAAQGIGSSASAPATTPTLSAEEMTARENAARGVLKDFFKAMFAGDQGGALALLVYTDVDDKGVPKAKEKAETMLGEVLAEQRLRKAVTGAFGDKPFKLGRGEADVAAFNKDFETATVKVSPDGNNAAVSMPLGIAYVLLWKEGKWLIDFDRTQAGIGPLPRVEDMEALTKMTEAYVQLGKDVGAKKYGTVEEVTKEVDKIVTANTMKVAATAPLAGATGAATRP